MSVGESAARILVTCQQTRFYLIEDNASKEIDIKGLGMVVASETPDSFSALKIKGKSKARAEGLEILTGAELRLKPGTHYALLGRNGTGKSSKAQCERPGMTEFTRRLAILRAIAEKLIPGIPLTTRISILQQTMEDETIAPAATKGASQTVLQHVIEGDTYRNQLLHELDVLSKGIDDTGSSTWSLRALRQVQHERLQREFFEIQKDAQLRSGSRGFDARKVLIAYEKRMEDSMARLKQDDAEIDNETVQLEIKAAVDLQADLHVQLENMQLVDMEAKARGILTGLGFEESMLSKPFSTLSGGWKMRCMLAAALTHTADIRILDEPTNYLDLLGIMWLQRYLISLSTTHPETILLLVSHDRAFIDAICSEVIILRDQKLTYFSGNLTSYEKDVKHQVLRMSRMKEAQDRQTAHMEKTVQNNIKIGKKTGDDNKLRQAKSRQKKIDDRMGLQVSATGGRFKLNRDLGGYHLKSRAEIEIPKEERGVQMVFPAAPELRHPGSLISLEKVAFSYPKAPKPIIVDIDLVIHMGDRIGLVGLNGVGKSSLVKLVVDETKPSKGTVSRHSRLKVGYYSQHAVEALQAQGQSEPTLTALTLFLRQFQDLFQEQQARQLLGSLGLAGRTASDVPIAKLSGGQLVRLALSLLLAAPPHLLVLDEISTHLDWQTVKALIGALADYDGAILLASHDRFMVRCVVEGHPADEEDGEDEEDEEDVGRALQRRRMVYQLKAGKLVERSGGMEAFEGSLEGRLKKMALI